MAARHSLLQLPPGIYNLLPNDDTATEIWSECRKLGCSAVQLPPIITDYLVAGTVIREMAFDAENLGHSRQALSIDLKRELEASIFSERANQATASLSGGEQQWLALYQALKQPEDYLFTRFAGDFLSPQRYRSLEGAVVDKKKRIMNFTFHDEGGLWEWESGHLTALENSETTTSASNVGAGGGVHWGLSVTALSVYYAESGFNLDIPALQLDGLTTLGLAGDNGSGKSTFADCLGGLTDYEGTIDVHIEGGKSPSVGYLTQQLASPTHGLSADEILALFVEQGRLTDEKIAAVKAFLDQDDWYNAMSTYDAAVGHRMLITAALLTGEYDLVILDEPAYGLPSATVTQYIKKLSNSFGSPPLIITGHKVNFLTPLCQKIIQLGNGSIR